MSVPGAPSAQADRPLNCYNKNTKETTHEEENSVPVHGGAAALQPAAPGRPARPGKSPYYYGICGENLSWQFDPDSGKLTIEGSGAMENFSWDGTPWYNFRSKIVTVSLPGNLTSIGDNAFRECGSLTSVTIPDGVVSIGSYVFRGCSFLTSATIPSSVTCIGNWAFADCSALTSVSIPNSVTSIGSKAFGWNWYGRVEGFTIYGYPESAAQIYAEENQFNFWTSAWFLLSRASPSLRALPSARP